MGTEAQTPSRGPVLALSAIVLVAFVTLAWLGAAIPVPRILSDELTYTASGSSLAEGDGLRRRGESYGFGPAYPAVLATILAFVPDRELAYPLFKIANALLFTLAALPIYLLARRLLPPWWSVVVAALSVAIPSSMYVSLVMTEATSYLTASLALLAIVLSLEKPNVPRQFAVLGAITLSFLVRPQFAVLFIAYLVAIGLQWAITPSPRPRARGSLRTLWPTIGAVVLCVFAFAAGPFLTGTTHAETLGAYSELWRGYNPIDVTRWLVYHLAALELYLAVVPLAVAPVVLSRLLRDRGECSGCKAAFASAFLAVNTCLLTVTAAFSSTEYGLNHLHDRYLFYVAPLWFIVLAVWLHDGLPRPLLATGLGVALALVLPAALPFSQLALEEGGVEADAVLTHLWAVVNATAFDIAPDHLSGQRVLAAFVLVLLAAVVLLPKRFRFLLVSVVAVVMVVTAGLAWRDAAAAARDMDVRLGEERAWVDNAVGTSGKVMSLYVSAPCGSSLQASFGLLLTEFFNRAVKRAAYISAPDGSLLPSTEARVTQDGRLVGESGEPLIAEYVLTMPGVGLSGRRVASGTSIPLFLWRVDGPVRVPGADDIGELQRRTCSASRQRDRDSADTGQASIGSGSKDAGAPGRSSHVHANG